MPSEATCGITIGMDIFWNHPFQLGYKNACNVVIFHLCYSEAIRSLESENEELMKDNTLAGSIQNQNQVLTLCRPSVFMIFLVAMVGWIC